jgi:GR25 family glycosyltransferase involved in LPS biosynthesis
MGLRTRRRRDIFSLPTYVINLKERPDRWTRFVSQPVTSSFKHLKRFYAVNGKRLNYRKDKRISIRTKLNITRNYRRSHYEIATLGAVGSSLSHIEIWKQFVASGKSQCLVLEDDAILTDSELRAVCAMTPPTDWGIWILGCYLPNLIVKPLENHWNQVYNFTAAHAYLLTRTAALKLLEQPFPIETHIEYYMTGTALLKDIKIVQHDSVHIEFFRKQDGPRTADSNTSQHKKTGCPTCNVKDDYRQLYKGFTRRSKRGVKIMGVVEAPQAKKILTLKNTAHRSNSVHP